MLSKLYFSRRSCLVSGDCFRLVVYVLNVYCDWTSFYGICGSFFFMNCIFLARGFSPVYKQNSAEFSVDFRELGYFRNLLSYSLGVGILVFQTSYDILFAL